MITNSWNLGYEEICLKLWSFEKGGLFFCGKMKGRGVKNRRIQFSITLLFEHKIVCSLNDLLFWYEKHESSFSPIVKKCELFSKLIVAKWIAGPTVNTSLFTKSPSLDRIYMVVAKGFGIKSKLSRKWSFGAFGKDIHNEWLREKFLRRRKLKKRKATFYLCNQRRIVFYWFYENTKRFVPRLLSYQYLLDSKVKLTIMNQSLHYWWIFEMGEWNYTFHMFIHSSWFILDSHTQPD